MLVKNITYHFNLSRGKSGLCWLDINISPSNEVRDVTSERDLLRAIDKDFSMLEGLMDKLLLDQTYCELKKTPIVNNSSSQKSVAFNYNSKTKTDLIDKLLVLSPLWLINRFKAGKRMTDALGRASAHLSYQLRKVSDGIYKEPHFSVKAQVGHELNLSILREVLALPKVELNKQAASELQELSKQLARFKELYPNA